jgi:hypothetical protein
LLEASLGRLLPWPPGRFEEHARSLAPRDMDLLE